MDEDPRISGDLIRPPVLVCGVYGFEVTKAFDAAGMHFEPRLPFEQASEAARAKDQYHLTAVVTADEFSGDILFRLEAVLSFIEHLDVIVTEPRALVDLPGFGQFPASLAASGRHDGGGALIAQDAFFSDSRSSFIDLAVRKLGDERYCESTGYRYLFFRATETFRQRRPLMEITFFLLFSGLETYLRKVLDSKDSDTARVFERGLRAMDLNVVAFSKADRIRSMKTYVRLRDALFHNSELTAVFREHGVVQKIYLPDYLFHFQMLVCLVVLKASAFDDGHTNWNAWIDRQLLM